MSVMSRSLPRLLPTCLVTVALAGIAFSQADEQLRIGHETPGFFGLEASTIPAWGLSYQTTGIYYTAQKQTNRHGRSDGTRGTLQHASAFGTVTWRSPWKILGGEYVTRLRTSLVANAPNPRGLNAGSDGLDIGDTYAEPMALYWNGEKGVVSLRYGWWFDTGHYAAEDANSSGKGFTSQVTTLAFTYYPHPDRLWNYSLTGRYSTHGKVSDRNVRPGEDIVLDWSIAKRLNPNWNVGLAGYGVFQTKKDRGADAATELGYYGKAALGVAARYSVAEYGNNAFARLYQEFNSFNHTEGTVLVLGLNFSL